MTRDATVSEANRIRAEFDRRARTLPADFYALTRLANLFADQQRARGLLRLLHRHRLLPLAGRDILDVGCGDGWQLAQFEHWGASAEHLAGIDLLPTRMQRASARFPVRDGRGPRLHLGDASSLPWADATFDVAHQSTVFSSILDGQMKRMVAHEIMRVLKPGGVLIWYDFFVDNPSNPAVSGIGAREIRRLFPGCDIRLRRVTLAPPLARRLVPITWLGSLVLERLTLLNTHFLGAIRKPQ